MITSNDSTPTKAVTKSSSPFANAHTTSIHPQRCLSRSKNLHFALAPFPGFSAKVGVRDSKDPKKTTLIFTPDEWKAFVAGVKDGEFDL